MMHAAKAVVLATALLASGAVAASAQPFRTAYRARYADVEYSWPAEAARVPPLVKRFRTDLAKQKARMTQCGQQESDVRIKSGSVAMKCESSTRITTSGRTARLLSLARAYWAFTGGAHGNGATTGLLWDLHANKGISFAALFVPGADYQGVLKRPYCAALDRERKKRRGEGYQPGGVPEFDSCPKLSDLALIPAASRQGGKLDRIHLIAAPYLAGSFAEGEYDIVLPVSEKLRRLLKPEYRSSFEVQRQ